jgi:hydrophobe/amphiphile efflux-1 (HAE1) family protein
MLTRIAINNPAFTWMLMASLILFGGISYTRLGVSQLPDVDFPVVNVRLVMPGAAAVVMETDVVDIVEDALMSVEGISEIRSSSSEGVANVTIDLEIGRNVDVSIQEILTKLSQAQKNLPPDLEPAIISKSNPDDVPILWIAVTSDKPLPELMTFVRDRLKSEFQTVSGTGEITLGGYADRNIRVWMDVNKMAAYELTADDISAAIASQHSELPAGRLEDTKSESSVRSMGEARSVSALRNLYIDKRGGKPVLNFIKLSQVADIEDSLEDVRRISRFNGVQAVGIGIRKQRGSNAVLVARAVRERIEEVKTRLPKGYSIHIANDNTRFVEEAVNELQFTMILSALLTGAVTWLFLGSLSSTFNILLAIPTSVIGAFTAMYFFGFTLNTFTLLALSLSIGFLVDDAIMILENIARHRAMGKSKMQASYEGTAEITFAAIATSLAIAAIFLPITFMEGVTGRYFMEFAVVVTVALALSLLESLTLTPMRTSQYLKIGGESLPEQMIGRVYDSLNAWYGRSILFILRHPAKILIAATVLFASSFLLLIPLKKEFIPPQDQSRFMVRIQTPVGSSLEFTNRQIRIFEEYLESRKEVINTFSVIGGPTGDNSNIANLYVTMYNKPERPVNEKTGSKITQSEFISILRKDTKNLLPGSRISIQDLSSRGFSSGRGFPVEFTIRGPELSVLVEKHHQIMKDMQESEFFTDIDADYTEGQPEIMVVPNRVAAGERGVSMETIGRTVGTMLAGKRAGRFTDGGHGNDIKVQLSEKQRENPENIKKFLVRNQFGEVVPLSRIVSLESRQSPRSITRVDRERAITIFANPSAGHTAEEGIAAAQKIAQNRLTAGYQMRLSGNAKDSGNGFENLIMALLLGVLISYMVLASQFNSFLHPLTVLLALPFSFSGAFAALLLTGQTLNVYSFIGLILLMGLVKKNSILLVEFANQYREKGYSVDEALHTACPLRLRPIIMTTVSSLAAAVPPALALGPGAETRIPMAVTIIGGLTVSTLLTLFIVPAAYKVLARFQRESSEKV